MGQTAIWLFVAAMGLGGCTSEAFAPAGETDAAVVPTDAAEGGDAARADAELESSTSDSSAEVGADGCALVTYYLDGDGDGAGGTTTMTACTPPGSVWAAVGGDCDDSNPDVHPGQKTFFATGYVPTGKSSTSFDYDCDGKEVESGASPKGACAVVNLACTGSGYIVAQPLRSGVGVDPYCGSSLAITCAFQSLVCKSGAPEAASAIGCR